MSLRGMKEDKAGWVSFFQRLRGRGLDRATLVVKMLKAIHAHERKGTVGEKAKAVVEELHSVKRKEATKKIADGMEETLTYCDFPSEHWTHPHQPCHGEAESGDPPPHPCGSQFPGR